MEEMDRAAVLREYIQLRKRGRGYLLLSEVQELLDTRDAETLHEALRHLSDGGLIAPLKSAKSNGSLAAPVYEKYRIVPPDIPRHELTVLHPLLTSTAYLERHPRECHEHWGELLSLSAWLSEGGHRGEASLRERCWEAFGNEKAAELPGLKKLVLKACGKELEEVLGARPGAPDCLQFATACVVGSPTQVVVSENRDPFLAVRDGLLSGRTKLFGERIDAVVWGGGDAVLQSSGASLRFTLETMHASSTVRVLYWGDIDREGLSILSKVCALGLASPFCAAYEEMLRASRHDARRSADERDLPVPELDGLFEPALAERLRAIADSQSLLPQEAVPYHAILGAMR